MEPLSSNVSILRRASDLEIDHVVRPPLGSERGFAASRRLFIVADVTDALRSLAQILHLANVFLVKHFFCLMRTLSVVQKYRLPSLSLVVTRWAMARDGGVSTDLVTPKGDVSSVTDARVVLTPHGSI